MADILPPASIPVLDVIVALRRQEAEDIISLELRPTAGDCLPAFTAGAHIDVHVPAGQEVLQRQYSLANDPSERHRYLIAVGRDPASRGGSRWIHDHVHQGQVLRISHPRNNFPLAEEAARSVLIAGGIGITPLVAMARRLATLGRKWSLYYCARTPARAAFMHDLLAIRGGAVVPVFDEMPGISRLDLHALAENTAAGTHLYCCGPSGLMRSFLDAVRNRDNRTVHVEWFAAPPETGESETNSAFAVHLARSNLTLEVGAGQSILEVVRAAGLDVPYSCMEGICGSCETKVISGECDHRDLILASPASNSSMMICVSRAKGDTITLDL